MTKVILVVHKKRAFARILPQENGKGRSEYFGPYTSFKTVNTILELIKELYPLRTCNYDLSKSNIESGNLRFARISYWEL
jgi:excinuclease ABC subunit C